LHDPIPAEKGSTDMMKNFGRISFFFGLAVLASAAPAFAQPVDRFHRVTSTASRDPRGSVSRDSRSVAARGSDPIASRLASTSRSTAARSRVSDSDTLHPFAARAEAESQNRETSGIRYSTRLQDPEPVAKAPQAASPPRSHNYYPALRSGVGPSQPVRLTTTPIMVPGSGRCTMSRSQAIGGMAHHR
jgi:hypothetical protein